MSPRRHALALVCAVACSTLGACSSSHSGDDEPDLPSGGLGELGGGNAGNDGKGATTDAGTAGAAGSAGDLRYQPGPTDALQVWVGDTRGSLSTCDDPRPWSELIREYRTVLLLWLGPDGDARGATVAFGDGAPLAPTEDLDTCGTGALVEGYDYPGHDVRLQDGRFELTFYRNDFFASWCAMQPSFPASETARQAWGRDYYCRDTTGVVDENSVNTVEASFDKPEELCVGNWGVACICDADACRAMHRGAYGLDLVVDGDGMEGWLVDPAGPSQVRLQRER